MKLSFANYKNKRFIILLILFTLLLKLSLAVYFSYLGNCSHPQLSFGYLAKASGDTFSYVGSTDNLIREGTFYFWNGERKVFAGRMPYYGAPYFLFRLFFDKTLASDLMVLLQIFFDALATVYFAKLCRDVLKRQAGFWIGYVLYLLSFNFFQNVLMLSTESLSLSFVVLFFYSFHRWWNGKNQSSVWTANIFLSLAFLLKPYLSPVFIVFWIIYCYRENLFRASRVRILTIKTALFGLPLILLLSPWLIRNLIVLRQPIVTQESIIAGYKETKADAAFRRFSGGWGGDFTYWDSESAACYFKLSPPFKCTFTLPSYSLTTKYSVQDIENVRSDYLAVQKIPSPEAEEKVAGEFDRLTEIYKSEKPFMFYIGSGFIRMKTMLWHTNNYNLPIYLDNPCFQPYQLWFKIIQTVIYYLSLTLGLAGLIWLISKKKISVIFVFVPVFLLSFFSFYVWNMEARYFSHAYPIMLLGLGATFSWIFSLANNKFYNNLD